MKINQSDINSIYILVKGLEGFEKKKGELNIVMYKPKCCGKSY
jgi:hypothetical protein